jgi:hypothetical protein
MPLRPGQLTIFHEDGRIEERDLLKCVHCQRIVEVKPGSMGTVYLVPNFERPGYHEESGAYCARCSGPICPACDDRGGCEHYERGLEREEARARRAEAWR